MAEAESFVEEIAALAREDKLPSDRDEIRESLARLQEKGLLDKDGRLTSQGEHLRNRLVFQSAVANRRRVE